MSSLAEFLALPDPTRCGGPIETHAVAAMKLYPGIDLSQDATLYSRHVQTFDNDYAAIDAKASALRRKGASLATKEDEMARMCQ